MGILNRPKAIETRTIVKKASETVRDDGAKAKLINIRNSLINLRNDKDKSIEDLTDIVIELVNVLENGK